MNAKSDDSRRDERKTETLARSGAGAEAGSRSGGRKRISARSDQYMIASTQPGLGEAALRARVEELSGVDLIRTAAARGAVCPPIAVVRMTSAKAQTLRQSVGGHWW